MLVSGLVLTALSPTRPGAASPAGSSRLTACLLFGVSAVPPGQLESAHGRHPAPHSTTPTSS
ncbi:hypothetical protein ACRAWF_05665 [Streptomyces sp. L7]